MPVRLNVVLAQVRGGLARNFAVHFPKGSWPVNLGESGQPESIIGKCMSARDARDFLAFLRVLERDKLAKVFALGPLVTLSGKPGKFLDGGEQAVPVPAGRGQAAVQFEEFGTRISFLPTVLGNGKIHLEVEPEKSQLDPAAGTTIGGAFVPGRITQRVRTTVEIEDGQTLLIGGLIHRTVTAMTHAVPVLAQVPFAGAALSRMFSEEEVELVVLITASVVRSIPCEQAAEESPRKAASERLRLLERRLRRLREEVDDLHREIRSLQPRG